MVQTVKTNGLCGFCGENESCENIDSPAGNGDCDECNGYGFDEKCSTCQQEEVESLADDLHDRAKENF